MTEMDMSRACCGKDVLKVNVKTLKTLQERKECSRKILVPSIDSTRKKLLLPAQQMKLPEVGATEQCCDDPPAGKPSEA